MCRIPPIVRPCAPLVRSCAVWCGLARRCADQSCTKTSEFRILLCNSEQKGSTWAKGGEQLPKASTAQGRTRSAQGRTMGGIPQIWVATQLEWRMLRRRARPHNGRNPADLGCNPIGMANAPNGDKSRNGRPRPQERPRRRLQRERLR